VTLNRSFLFAPGNVARRVEKALALEADAVILDLEDSVAPGDKAATRKPVAEALRRPRRGRGYVRVNAPSSPFCYADLVETIHQGVDGVVLPKVESAADLHAIDWLIAALERSRGIAEGSIDLMPLIETAAGVQRVDRVLQARSLRPYPGPWRVRRVCFGAADYANDLGLTVGPEEEPLAEARARIVLASRAAGMESPIDRTAVPANAPREPIPNPGRPITPIALPISRRFKSATIRRATRDGTARIGFSRSAVHPSWNTRGDLPDSAMGPSV